jgi:hypothetical protein
MITYPLLKGDSVLAENARGMTFDGKPGIVAADIPAGSHLLQPVRGKILIGASVRGFQLTCGIRPKTGPR